MNQLIIDRLAAQSTDDILGVPVLDRSRFAIWMGFLDMHCHEQNESANLRLIGTIATALLYRLGLPCFRIEIILRHNR